MMPGPPKITLDQESFKALASDVRVGILKILDERRQTVTDLSALMGLSKPTLLEHLEKLQAAGLAKRIDEGRKWIYYELSDKGRKILHPEKVSIVVALSSAVVLAAIGIFSLLATTTAFFSGAPRTGSAEDGALAQYPAPLQAVASGGMGLAILLFVLAGACVGIVFLLRYYGIRRRARFFAQLASS